MSKIQHYIYANKKDNYVEIGASTLDGKTNVPLEEIGDAFCTYSYLEHELNNLTGKVLTLCDATISDKQQNKAVKDIIRSYVSETFQSASDFMQKEVVKDFEKEMSEMSNEDFTKHMNDNPPLELADVICPSK